MAGIQRFEDWEKRFNASSAGAKALAALASDFPSANKKDIDPTLQNLRHDVLRACYGAAMFEESSDPSESRRQADRNAIKALPSQRKAVACLRQFLSEYPTVASMALAGRLRPTC